MSGALTEVAKKVRSAGRYTDDQLVHLSTRELAKLNQMWGPPTTNPETGLPEYFLGDILGGISDVVNVLGGGFGELFGGGSGAAGGSSGGGDWMSSLINGVGSLFGGSGPTTSAPSTNRYGGVTGADGGGATPTSGGGSPFNWGKALNIVGALTSFVGQLQRNRQFQHDQHKLQKQQQQQYADYNQHVNYPIGQGNIVYNAPGAPTEFAGFGPESGMLHYARGGRSGMGALAHRSAQALQNPQGQIPGPGTGQSDDVPALLSKDEYVMPADVVSHLGDGSSGAGAKKLDKLVKHVRVHRTGNAKFPKQMGGLNQMTQMMGS